MAKASVRCDERVRRWLQLLTSVLVIAFVVLMTLTIAQAVEVTASVSVGESTYTLGELTNNVESLLSPLALENVTLSLNVTLYDDAPPVVLEAPSSMTGLQVGLTVVGVLLGISSLALVLITPTVACVSGRKKLPDEPYPDL